MSTLHRPAKTRTTNHKYYCYLLMVLGTFAACVGWHTDMIICIAAACIIASRKEEE